MPPGRPRKRKPEEELAPPVVIKRELKEDDDQSIIECCVCFLPFTDETGENRPVIVSCGHSFCEKCSKYLYSCPTCKKKFLKASVIKNFQLIDQIKRQNELQERQKRADKLRVNTEKELREDLSKTTEELNKKNKETAELQTKFTALTAATYTCCKCKFLMKKAFLCFECMNIPRKNVVDNYTQRLKDLKQWYLCGSCCIEEKEIKKHSTVSIGEIEKEQDYLEWKRWLDEILKKNTEEYNSMKNLSTEMQKTLLNFQTTLGKLYRMDASSVQNKEKLYADLNVINSHASDINNNMKKLKKNLEDVVGIMNKILTEGKMITQSMSPYGFFEKILNDSHFADSLPCTSRQSTSQKTNEQLTTRKIYHS